MPSVKERRQFNAANRFRAGGSANANSYTQFEAAAGYQTMSGCARVYKELFLRPVDFDVTLAGSSAASVGAMTACSSGSLYAGCVLLDVTGTIFGGTAGSPALIALTMGVGASPASALTATTFVPRPTDADTSGSIIAYVHWTTGLTPSTTGSHYTMYVGAGYLAGNATTAVGVRTAASAGPSVCAASYSGTSCGLMQSTCIGKLPSFGACDTGIIFILKLGASGAANQGNISTGCMFVTGVSLRYLSNTLGVQSIE